MKHVLEEAGSNAWLKWPNDLYLKDKKVGGVITHVSGRNLICGIGLNLVSVNEYVGLDIKADKKTLINAYITELKKFPEWKKIFRQFRIEFEQSKRLKTHAGGEEISLENASLECDGSLTINGKRVFSLR
jgi:BirA family biotin operon repressor/biotin-[acetyl-CoA-carboxylase] ligase